MLANTIRRIRRNHGLEHATIHVLSEKHKNFSAQGNSTLAGFHLNVFGDINEMDVAAAVDEALRRLRGGEHQLAVHPNCGTVLVTTAALTTLAAQSVFALEERRTSHNHSRALTTFNALPGAVVAVVVALIVSRPVGISLQRRFTVEGNPGDLRVNEVRAVSPSLVSRVFHVLLTGGNRKLPPTSYFVSTSNGYR